MLILSPEKELKIGSKEPEKRQKNLYGTLPSTAVKVKFADCASAKAAEFSRSQMGVVLV